MAACKGMACAAGAHTQKRARYCILSASWLLFGLTPCLLSSGWRTHAAIAMQQETNPLLAAQYPALWRIPLTYLRMLLRFTWQDLRPSSDDLSSRNDPEDAELTVCAS